METALEIDSSTSITNTFQDHLFEVEFAIHLPLAHQFISELDQEWTDASSTYSSFDISLADTMHSALDPDHFSTHPFVDIRLDDTMHSNFGLDHFLTPSFPTLQSQLVRKLPTRANAC